MSNHLRNLRALFESAKSFEVSRKVDTYEYESLEKMVALLEDNDDIQNVYHNGVLVS